MRVDRRSVIAGLVAGWGLVLVLWLLVEGTTIADRIVRPLQRSDTTGTADAIVVLGAGYYEPCGANLSSLRRTLLAVRLWRDGRAPVVVFTGGPTSNSRGKPVARAMGEIARAMGVPDEAIVEEIRSRDTWENAERSAPALRSRAVRRVLLVTDGIHMRRAEDCFREFGFEIERASVPQACVSSSQLDMLRSALHEYGGRIWYALDGRSAAP